MVGAPSGTLEENAGNILTTNDYTLNVTATDGDPAPGAPDSSRRSGVKTLAVYVDDELRFTTPEQSCTAAVGSCPMTADWTFEAGQLPVGEHTIRIVATDQLDHSSAPQGQSFPITVRDDSEESAVTMTAGSPTPDGSYRLTISATDPTSASSYGSGIDRIEAYVDGVLVGSTDQTCPADPCSLIFSEQLPASQSPQAVEISAVVYDRAGNSTVEYLGKNTGRYAFFGYNDFYGPERAQLAIDGGANILRFSVDWCDIAKDGFPGLVHENPATWDWRGADAIFELVHDKNTNVDPVTGAPITTDDTRVIPVLVNSPASARIASEPQGCNVPTPPAQTSQGIARWKTFVSQVVDRY